MMPWALLVTISLLSACSTLRPAVALHQVMTGPGPVGGQRVEQAGVSFVPPAGRNWVFLVRSTYQATLGAMGTSAGETFVTAAAIYQLPAPLSPTQFLAHVKAGRADEPQTGRFETIRNVEEIDTDRAEVCVKHRTATRDYGASRDGDFSIVDYIGMNCIHPTSPQVGVFVEFSRKAPTADGPDFDAEGLSLLRSVTFSPFH